MKHAIVLLAGILSFNTATAQNEVSCAFTSMNTDITANTTLSPGTLYRIEGCVKVTNGATLTIPAGTRLMGEKASTGTLIIDKGAKLQVAGTATQPVVFTSDQEHELRQPGDWGGIVMLGDAPVNVGSTITVSRHRSCAVTAGGSTAADNSGSLEYLRIEFPVYGLTLVGVGSATRVEHVQVSEAAQTSFDIHGGGPELKKLISLNARRNDVLATAGNVSKGQFLLGLRLDRYAYVSDGERSNGIVLANNYDTAGSFVTAAGKPDNRPIYSNVTLIGPGYCHESYDEELSNGVLYFQNTKGGIFNSVISGWNTGLMLNGTDVLTNADNGSELYFAENTFFNNSTTYDHSGTWPGSCAPTFADWVNADGLFSTDCEQLNNQPNTAAIGYASNLCNDICSNRPTLTVDPFQPGYNMLPPDHSPDALNDLFFEASDLRGAFGTNDDWTAYWANFCPQSTNYCPAELMRTSIGGVNSTEVLMLYPNPARAEFSVNFTVDEAGRATVRILDQLGRTVQEQDHATNKGQNSIAVATSNWAKGIYFVNLDTEGTTRTVKLVIE